MAMSAAAMPLNAPRVTHMHSTPDDDVDMDEEGDSELEEEIDQLDSDTEEEVPVAVISTSTRPRARQKKPAERVPGVVLLPLDRLENILEPDGVGIHMSKEAYFMLAAATEAFIKRLASAGLHRASLERRSMINYRDVASLPVQYREFTFLQETMPRPISLSEALQRRAAKAQEVIAPSASASAVPSPSPSSLPNFTPAGTPTPSIAGDLSQLSVSKGKGRQTNGKGGSASATPALTTAPRTTNNASHPRGQPADANGKPLARRQSTREPKPRRRPDEDDDAMVVDEPSGGARATHSRARAPRERTMKANVGVESVSGDGRYSSAPAKNGLGHGASAQNGAETTAAGGKHKQSAALQTSAPSFHGEYLVQPLDVESDRWAAAPPGHPAAVASISGQFSGPGVPYGRSGLLDNPGRTIYSQQRPANH